MVRGVKMMDNDNKTIDQLKREFLAAVFMIGAMMITAVIVMMVMK
jgi:hypothetical protein